MRRLVALFIAMGWSALAMAGEKLEFGPPPAWVKPVEAPTAGAKDDGAAVRSLLLDQQVQLDPGNPSVFARAVIKIQTPQGLGSGNISLPWRPEFDTLTVHKLNIQRGDQLIDVLASGQTFTVLRRESNLEMAMLDGVLTANIQPEGLQVGDIVEIAFTRVSRDPTLKDSIETLGGGWNGRDIARVHYSASWPSSAPVRLRQTKGLPEIKPVRSGARTGIELTLNDLQPLILPKRAPLRFLQARSIELSGFQSWADVAALMQPLYEKAAVIPAEGPLRAEVDKIKALSSDRAVRVEAALALVEDRVRYVALLLGAGNYVPADATTTWSRRFGDCKGKSALLLALLRELGIPAEAVLVNTMLGDGIDQRLPMLGLFNHVIVRATVHGKIHWLDGTRTGDRKLDQLPIPEFGWGLPVMPRAALVRIMPPPFEEPTVTTAVSIDNRAGLTLPAPIRIERLITGDGAYGMQRAFANMSGATRDTALRDYWRREYDYVEVATTTAAYDQEKREYKLAMEGTAKLDWRGGVYWTDDSDVGFSADFTRDGELDKNAPYAVSQYPSFSRNHLTIMVPPGVTADDAEVNETVAGIEYRRRASLKDNVFTLERSQRSIAPEFPAADAPAAQERLRALSKKNVALRTKAYAITDQELKSVLKLQELTPDALAARGAVAAQAGRFEDAIADFDRALAINPEYAVAYAARGHMMFQRYRIEEAKADFARALQKDPNNALGLLGQSWFALSDGRLNEALALADKAIAVQPKNVEAFTHRALVHLALGDKDGVAGDLGSAKALEPRSVPVLALQGKIAVTRNALTEAIDYYSAALTIRPTDPMLLGERAEVYRRSGDTEKALTDIHAAIGLAPSRPEFYLAKANMLRDKGEAAVVAVASEVTAAAPDNGFAHVIAARIYQRYNRDSEALRAFDRAIALKPEAYIYLNRYHSRPISDVAGRRADLEQSLKLDPDFVDALETKAAFEEEMSNPDAAIAIWSDLLAKGYDAKSGLIRRGLVYLKSGKTELGEKDLAAGRDGVTDANMLNNICYAKVIAGVALDSALADCNAAILLQPDNMAFLDSRGFAFLRLGRFDAAIADFDRAIAKDRSQSNPLFGRAIAWARKGNTSKSRADLAAAIKINPNVADDFRRHGLTL